LTNKGVGSQSCSALRVLIADHASIIATSAAGQKELGRAMTGFGIGVDV
jgi:hypothetical protein